MLSDSLHKIRAFIRWSNLKKLVRAPFRGGIQAALSAWRERRREALPNDVTHTFQARSYPGS
ncbi:MAG: hypothetical protein GWP56_17945, partial [Gammaproteobacteria bacterium]|nr:hypothetical protein [Gammaproteobacteria bacterium]